MLFGGKITIIFGAILATLIGIFYWYYTTTQSTINTLTENNAKLETAVAISEETVSSLQTLLREQSETILKINRRFNEIRQENSDLKKTLSENNLGKLAYKKPGLIENRVNNGTKNVLRCIELLSGANPTEEELKKTNENNKCVINNSSN